VSDQHAEPGTGDGTVTVVRIAGLMRSGSNLLTWVLRHNFRHVLTATMLLGWKHGPIFRDRAELAPDDFVDPRYRGNLRAFMREQPAQWARLLASAAYQAAAAQQRTQSFAVALAVREPALWYASCVRAQRESPGFLLHGTTPGEAARFWNDSHRAWLATLGERSVIVDTDALRREPEPWLERIGARLRLSRLPGSARLPQGYLHPQGTEEVYELLGAPIEREMQRELTTTAQADPGQIEAFGRLLDRNLLARLGLGAAA